MGDLQERAKAALSYGIGLDTKAVIREQMAEIERLRAKSDRYREALVEIANIDWRGHQHQSAHIASRALRDEFSGNQQSGKEPVRYCWSCGAKSGDLHHENCGYRGSSPNGRQT